MIGHIHSNSAHNLTRDAGYLLPRGNAYFLFRVISIMSRGIASAENSSGCYDESELQFDHFTLGNTGKTFTIPR